MKNNPGRGWRDPRSLYINWLYGRETGWERGGGCLHGVEVASLGSSFDG